MPTWPPAAATACRSKPSRGSERRERRVSHRASVTIPLFERAEAHGDRTAIVAPEGSFAYRDLLEASSRVALTLLDGGSDLAEARVAFLVSPGFYYPRVQWGIWHAGGIAVPLSPLHPAPELEYVLRDAGVSTVVCHPDFEERLRPLATSLGLRWLLTDDISKVRGQRVPDLDPYRRA